MHRRSLIASALSAPIFQALGAFPAFADTAGDRLARAALAQVGVTTDYDPAYLRLPYPGGDPPRSTGVCADVVVRAARDALGLDLQQLVHEDMKRHFAAYPRAWGLSRADRNIDHRRVLNLEAFWTRAAARLWRPAARTAGNAFPLPLQPGDLVTWRLDDRLPHVAVVSRPGRVVHNIGGGAREVSLTALAPHRATGHYRWPRA